jgi:hypothetical protein
MGNRAARRLTTLLMIGCIFLLCGFRGKKDTPPGEVRGTVTNVLNTEHRTYIEVQRDDGIREWLDMNSTHVGVDNRVAYIENRSPLYNTRIWETGREFNRLSFGEGFRILPEEKDDRIYRSKGPDDTLVFTDNPSSQSEVVTFDRKETAQKETPPKRSNSSKRQEQKTPSTKDKEDDDMIVISQEELLRQEAFIEEYNRNLEQMNAPKKVRRAKRAKPQ